MAYQEENGAYMDHNKGPEDLVSVDQNGASLDPQYVPTIEENKHDVTEATAVPVDPKA